MDVETTTVTQYPQISQAFSARMVNNVNAADGMIASDAEIPTYSGTPQGVQAQREDKSTSINQFQKNVETFFAAWANHALRSYLNAHTGIHEMTVSENTRRKIWDVETEIAKAAEQAGEMPPASIIKGNKIEVDFSKLSTDILFFKVRTGSLIEDMKEVERNSIQEMLIAISQMMGNVSDDNRPAFETSIMQMMQRLVELSNIDLPLQIAGNFSDSLEKQALMATMEEVMMQGQQLQQLLQGQPQLPGGQMQQDMGQPPTMGMQASPGGSQQPTQGFTPQPQAEVSAEFPEQGAEGLPVTVPLQ